MQEHRSIFSLLGRNMQAYTISWVTTFIASIVNVLWTVWVFHFDFVSNIDGALASQIGVVLVNELFLLYSVIRSRKYLFGLGGPINIVWILLTAAFICLLLYAPMIAFKTYAMLTGVVIDPASAPLFDAIDTTSTQMLAFASSHVDLSEVHAPNDPLISQVLSVISGLVALMFLRSFFRSRPARG